MLKIDPDNLSEEDLDELYDNTTGEGFPLISKADLPDNDAFREDQGYDAIEDKLRPERRAELESGADPTPEELALYRKYWQEGLSDMTYDMDVIPTCGIAPFIGPDGRKLFALVCRTGYSFSRIETWLEGVFSSEADAQAYIEEYRQND
jgi:hypothetical protein